MVVERQQVGHGKPFIGHRMQVIGEITGCSIGLIKKSGTTMINLRLPKHLPSPHKTGKTRSG